MNLLYLVKSFPIREYYISKVIIESTIEGVYKEVDISIDCVTFSQRNYLDIDELQKNEKVFTNVYNFTDFARHEKQFPLGWVSEKLKTYEEKYNIPINFALHADRHIINHDETRRRQKICLIVEFALKIINEKKINYIIGELSSASDIIFYYLAMHFSIPYLFFWHGRVKNRFEFSNIKGERFDLKEIYEEKKKNGLTVEEEQFVDDYLDGFWKENSQNISPDYMKFADTTKWKQLFKKTYHDNGFKRLFKFAFSYYYDRQWSADMDPSIRLKVKQRLNKMIYPLNRARLKKYFQSSNIKDEYYLFPLHYQPEASTMTFAQDYLNQLAFIENIVKHLPGGAYLYVKEHPSMIAYRNASFYKQLTKMPNVKLIAPNESIKDLILKSQGVITLTSTTGYEAIIYDKPVFVFGSVFYQEYDHIYKCDNYNEFSIYIRQASVLWNKNNDSRQINIKCFIFASLKSLKVGNLNSHVYDYSVLEQSNIRVLVEELFKYFRAF